MIPIDVSYKTKNRFKRSPFELHKDKNLEGFREEIDIRKDLKIRLKGKTILHGKLFFFKK